MMFKMNSLEIKSVLIKIIIILVLFTTWVTGQSPISIQLKNDFPVLSIENPAGDPVIIQPISPLIGSIGFASTGDMEWLKGKPEQTEGSNQYTWTINATDQVSLHVIQDEVDLNLHFTWTGINIKKPDKWFINFASDQHEYFTGIFERVVDGHQNNSWEKGIQTALNLRGERVEMKLKPTVSAYAPFYLSSKKYGLYVKGTWPGTFDFCKKYDQTVQVNFEGPELNFKLYFGSPLQIVQKHAMETGPSFCPPEWAFGPWRWRDEHKNRTKYYNNTEVKAPFNSELVEDVLMMKALDIPCTAYWVDRPWGLGPKGFDDYELDSVRFPQHQQMIQWLNKQGMEYMIWIAPWVMGNMADEAVKNGYTVKSRSIEKWPQELIDFTNPKACEWWSEKGPAKLARMGIRGYKLDRADGEKHLDSFDLKAHSGQTYREIYNDYPRQFVQTTFDAVQPILGDNFILFPRAQYTGSAKYGGMWAGDTNGRPEGLRSAIIGLLRCAIMGYPIWGSDTGGYWGDFSHETCMRWLAFSCFSPIMEVGPTNNRGFWDNPEEPQYDVELIATWRLYAKIRKSLQPYIHELAKKASETGVPVVRPIFLNYPDQTETWEDWQTFLLGPDILVSAIWESNVKDHKLYLPAGETWIDAWNYKKHEGGQHVKINTPVYKIPIFIRQGAAIDLGDLNKLYQESLKIATQRPDLAKLEKAEGWR
ncbi:glycoside hydrolase family 31 protein [bacterium]